MRTPGSRVVLAGFIALSLGVGANLLAMQPAATATNRVALDRAAQKAASERSKRLAVDAALPKPAEAAVVQPAPPAGDLAGHVQKELAARGYEPGSSDGVTGLVTRAAIMAFEHDHGLALTGEPSELLLRALQGGPASVTPATYAVAAKDKRQRAEQVVRTVQQTLSALGYASGKPTGRFSEETERAIREFEMDQGLKVTGRISAPLVTRFAKLAGTGKVASGR